MAKELNVLIEKLNVLCKKRLEEAAALCLTRQHYYIETEHWFASILSESRTDLHCILQYYAIDVPVFLEALQTIMDGFKTGNVRAPAFSQYVLELLNEAWSMASLHFADVSIRSGYLVAALVSSQQKLRLPSQLSSLLDKMDGHDLLNNFQRIVAGSQEEVSITKSVSSVTPSYTIDVTELARLGKIDPVIGREQEIRQLIDILMRRRQNNPILTGEAGVGKTAVLEGFALKIISGDVPPALQGVTVRSLDLGALQAGASVKGEFENRLKAVIDQIKASPQPIILFIDEAHMLIGAGGSAGQHDAANLLKPALARGELRTIAATTWLEYKKYFEQDPALVRRFQPVKVEEPSEEMAIAMLRGLVATLKKHHQVMIDDQAVVDAVQLSKRYIADRQLPDKAISLLDTACAKVAISQNTIPSAIDDLQQCCERLKVEKSLFAMDEQSERLQAIEGLLHDYEEKILTLTTSWQKQRALVENINVLRQQSQEKEAFMHLRDQLAQEQGDTPLVHDCVNSYVIAETIASWTGIPVGRMLKSELNTVLNLHSLLAERIIGQDHALQVIADTMRTASARLADPRKPRAVFLFAGTSGVGKTETALALAELLYGDEKNLTVMNMSEFKEEHKVAMLLGSPPGYVGYGEGGVLTEAIRRKPYSLVLLDEMEKAHPGVQDIFYQMFDKGVLRDGQGRMIDCKNTVIIMTTNAGTQTLSQYVDERRKNVKLDEVNQHLQPELLHYFKPAFLGRVSVIPYYPLGDHELVAIVHLQLTRIQKRVMSQYHVMLTYEPRVAEQIAKRCLEIETGARNVEHLLNHELLPQLATTLLEGYAEKKEVTSITVSVAEEKRGFVISSCIEGASSAQ